jgi:hypothetical protein
MIGGIDQGVAAMHAGFERMDKAAVQVARDGAAGDPAGQTVETLRAVQEVGAGVAVVRALDAVTGCLLDELA